MAEIAHIAGAASRRLVSRGALVFCALAVLALPTPAASASSVRTRECPTRVDLDHMVWHSGHGSLVHRGAGHRVALVLLHVRRSALRVAIAGRHSCRIDLARFERRWKRAPYELHARLWSPTGSWEIRVAFVHYDAARHLLRARGVLEDHRRARPRADGAVVPSPQSPCPDDLDCSTEIVYASTYVPFDSSF